ncbi:MAG: SDR family oxidoreductase [Tepidisphaeraceae bacterium]
MDRPRKVALVTGGARRVGRAIVRKFASAGFDVAFTFLSSRSEADSLLLEIPDALAIEADLSNPDQAAAKVFAEFSSRFDRLDVLVNSASRYAPARLRDTDMKLMRSVAAIHVQSPLLLCQKFEPMLRASQGHVINMVDLLAERPWPEYLIYCASKAALASLTLGLARELAPEVTVNAIAPGVVDWPDDYPQSERDKYLKRVPLGRAGTPQDVANLACFLATEGSYITGQIIRLDGGRSIT